jgi:hypothetical protein
MFVLLCDCCPKLTGELVITGFFKILIVFLTFKSTTWNYVATCKLVTSETSNTMRYSEILCKSLSTWYLKSESPGQLLPFPLDKAAPYIHHIEKL